MAAPTTLTPVGEYMTVTIDKNTGITSNSPDMQIGLVESVGIAVTAVGVGQYIMFGKSDFFSDGTASWAIVHQDKINSVITPLLL